MARLSPPLLFLGAVASLWIGGRFVLASWPASRDGQRPPQVAAHRPAPLAVPVQDDGSTTWRMWEGRRDRAGVRHGAPVEPFRRIQAVSGQQLVVRPELVTPASIAASDIDRDVPESQAAVARALPPAALMPPAPAAARPPAGRRWSLSGWAFVRPDAGPTTLGRGLLGGSQVGARAAWRLDRGGRVQLYARAVSSGRPGDGVEAALGVSAQPVAALPVRLSVERRQQLVGDGGRSAFAAFASGGVDDVPLPIGFRLDGYAAAGVVGASHRDLFAEGSAVARRPLLSVGTLDLDAGAGAWAAIQPDIERVDVGPSIGIRWRSGAVEPRLSLEWRERILGGATPQSGVAVTLAADF